MNAPTRLGMSLLEKTIDCYLSRDWTKSSREEVESMLAAFLFEELITLEVASNTNYTYNTNRPEISSLIIEFLKESRIIPHHMIEEDANSVVDLYVARHFAPTHSVSVEGGDDRCEWQWGCPASDGSKGSITVFHKDHILPNCSSELGFSERLFDPEVNSQRLCDLHNTKIKRDNIALGAVTRGLLIH